MARPKCLFCRKARPCPFDGPHQWIIATMKKTVAYARSQGWRPWGQLRKKYKAYLARETGRKLRKALAAVEKAQPLPDPPASSGAKK